MIVEDLAGRVCQIDGRLAAGGVRSAAVRSATSHDDGGGPVDLHDVDLLARFVGLAGVEGAGGPDLAGELDAAAACRRPVPGRRPDGPSARRCRCASSGPLGAVPGRDGPYDGDERDRDDDEDEDLGDDAAAERRVTAAATAPTANMPNSGIAVSDERNAQPDRADQPPHPCVDVHMVMVGPRSRRGQGAIGWSGCRCRGVSELSGQRQALGGPAVADAARRRAGGRSRARGCGR